MYLPYAHDPVTGKPSVTLLFLYITFVMASGSLLALHFKPSVLPATITSIIFWAMSMVFYRLRKLDKASFDLKNGKIEVEDTPDAAGQSEKDE